MDLMLLAKAAVMGVVEGLTEFLPISSTGHLILAGALLGFDDDKAKVFDIAIQTGAIFAVILVYWQKISDTFKALPYQAEAQRFVLNVFIGFLPAVVLGLLFGKLIKEHLFTPWVVATTFIVGGFIILWAERRPPSSVRIRAVEDMRGRMRRDKGPQGPWSIKHRPGGLVDAEFIVQYLALATPGARPAARA